MELLLQLCQPAVDVRHTHCPTGQGQQFHPHSFGDLPGQSLLFAHHRVEDSEDRPLERFLVEGGGLFAVFGAVVHPAGAAPHRPFLPPLVPHTAAVEGAAAAADQPLGEGVFAAVTGSPGRGVPLVWGASGVPSGKLGLYRVEFVPADDPLVVVLDEVHGELTGVLDGFFADAVAHIGFLQQHVPAVDLILENTSDCRFRPAFPSGCSWDLVLLQFGLDHTDAVPHEEAVEHSPHHLRLLGDDAGLVILAAFVGIEVFVLEGDLSLPHGLPPAPFDIGAHRFAFCLRKRPHQGQQHLAFCVHRIDVLLLEYHRDAQLLESADVAQAVHRIAGKAGDGLDQYEIDLSLPAFANHFEKFRAFGGGGAGDPLVRKNARHRPVGVLHDHIGVVGLLGLVAGELLLVLGGHPAVGGYPQLALRFPLLCRLRTSWDNKDAWGGFGHDILLLSMVCPFFSRSPTDPSRRMRTADAMLFNRSWRGISLVRTSLIRSVS